MVKIWDFPLRLFHWSMVVVFIGLVGSAFGDEVSIHIILGQTMMGLLIFRLLWGIFGGHYGRFLTGIKVIFSKKTYLYGHSRLGWLSSFLILALLAIQVSFGMFSLTDEIVGGPWNKYISYELSRDINYWHAEILGKVLIAIVIVHLCGVMYHTEKINPRAVKAMVDGKTDAIPDHDHQPVKEQWIKFITIAIVSVFITMEAIAL